MWRDRQVPFSISDIEVPSHIKQVGQVEDVKSFIKQEVHSSMKAVRVDIHEELTSCYTVSGVWMAMQYTRFWLYVDPSALGTWLFTWQVWIEADKIFIWLLGLPPSFSPVKCDRWFPLITHYSVCSSSCSLSGLTLEGQIVLCRLLTQTRNRRSLMKPIQI